MCTLDAVEYFPILSIRAVHGWILHIVLLAGLSHVHSKMCHQDEAGSPCQDYVAILFGENSHLGAVRKREPVSISLLTGAQHMQKWVSVHAWA